eukprot:TRINITY_DN6289_c0_g1_i1.p1 TRINITY_DN6289_c0_g1~~TRINITY_DN6289_c0_g1_i1.p1  ORF type:complete len:200 (+),score=37.49 TRINITY_DN6289_c0_g1_i1:81-680(+)
MLLVAAATALCCGSVTVQRTVISVAQGWDFNVTITPRHPISSPHRDGCAQADQYGSNDCTLEWNHSYGVSAAVAEPGVELGPDVRVKADAMIDGVLPLSVDCPVCGPRTAAGPANCSVTVPLPLPPPNNRKTFNISLPECPLRIPPVKGGNESWVSMPAADYIGVATRATGTVTVTGPKRGDAKFQLTLCADRYLQVCK